MAESRVLEFIQKAEQDRELGARVRAVDTADRAQAFAALARIAADAGYAVTPAALEAGLNECAPRELSDGDLDQVAGGTTTPCGLTFSSSSLSPTSSFSGFFKSNSSIEPCW